MHIFFFVFFLVRFSPFRWHSHTWRDVSWDPSKPVGRALKPLISYNNPIILNALPIETYRNLHVIKQTSINTMDDYKKRWIKCSSTEIFWHWSSFSATPSGHRASAHARTWTRGFAAGETTGEWIERDWLIVEESLGGGGARTREEVVVLTFGR